jgi:hypothetical protein
MGRLIEGMEQTTTLKSFPTEFPHKENWKTNLNLVSETSFGIVDQENGVECAITVGLNSPTYGYFEVYDVKSGGERWYAEGGLWIENGKLTDYDGTFSLLPPVKDKLAELGVDVSDF